MGTRYEKEPNYTSPITAAVATMAMLFAPMAEAQSSKPRLGAVTRIENTNSSVNAYPSTQAMTYCKQLVEKAWTLVRKGRTVEAGNLNFEEVLECFADEKEMNRFMDAHDAVEKRAN